jgi:hypothetical protein
MKIIKKDFIFVYYSLYNFFLIHFTYNLLFGIEIRHKLINLIHSCVVLLLILEIQLNPFITNSRL